MRFDADAWLESETPPTFTVGGRTYVGRHLSADEQLRHLAALAQITDEASDTETRRIIEAFVSDLFPDPLTPALPARGWRLWRRRPPPPLRVLDLFRALPLGAQLAAVRGFSAVLASTMVPTPGPMTTRDAPSASATTSPLAGFPTSASSSRSSSIALVPPRITPPGAGPRGTA